MRKLPGYAAAEAELQTNRGHVQFRRDGFNAVIFIDLNDLNFGEAIHVALNNKTRIRLKINKP
jgi:hypothetical protein